jgi:hypothetical protein
MQTGEPVRPIKPLDVKTTTHIDLIDKINEIIDRINYISLHGVREPGFKAGLPLPQRDE